MAFEEMTLKAKTPRADVIASIGGCKPESLTLTLSFSAGCAAQLGISDKDRMKVLIGTERDEGSKPSHQHSIDRIDNDGNYEPGNCRWATAKQQANNRRKERRRLIDEALARREA